MIGYLQGTVLYQEPQGTTRTPLVYRLTLEVQGVGYDVQITARYGQTIAIESPLALFIHLQVREDQLLLFGFSTRAERDLFRQLIQISGIGPQMAMALLHTLGLTDLVKAIVTGNTRVLCLTPGVGTKTAERIALELKSKLADWRSVQVEPTTATLEIQADLEMTLLALGYTSREIAAALRALLAMPHLHTSQPLEEWIRAAIAWLSSHEA